MDEQTLLDEQQIYRRMLLALIMVATLFAFGLILWPFLSPVAWALCLAAVSMRPYRILATKLKRPRLAAFLMVLIIPTLILIPLVGVGAMLIEEVQAFDIQQIVKSIEAALNEPGEREAFVKFLDGLAEKLGRDDFAALAVEFQGNIETNLPRLLSGSFAKGVFTLVTAPLLFLFGFLIMLVTLYFVYCEGKRIRRMVVDLSPLLRAETEEIIANLRGVTNAAIMGGLVVALIQGLLGGISFVIAELDSPALWGLVMAGASLLPFGGTALVWLPAGIYLLAMDRIGAGWFVLAWGAIIVGVADNVLRPWILSKTGASDIHPMMLFFAILSGIGLFGISGIVFGPLLLSFVITVLRIYRTAPEEDGGDGEPMPAVAL